MSETRGTSREGVEGMEWQPKQLWLEKIQTKIGNKLSELRKLHQERDSIDRQIAHAEGVLSGLRDAEDAINEEMAKAPPVTTEASKDNQA